MEVLRPGKYPECGSCQACSSMADAVESKFLAWLDGRPVPEATIIVNCKPDPSTLKSDMRGIIAFETPDGDMNKTKLETEIVECPGAIEAAEASSQST